MSVFDDVFDVFDIGFPTRERLAAMDKASLKALKGKLPDELLALYAQEGLFAFGDGLFYFLDPLEHRDLLKAWGVDPGEHFLFLRTAFGDLFHWDGSNVHVVHVNSGVKNALGPSITRFLNFGLHSAKYNEKTLFGKLLPKAKLKLGPLRSGECYAFIEPITGKGKETVANLRRVDLADHVRALARANG